jgi:hypothetical protein
MFPNAIPASATIKMCCAKSFFSDVTTRYSIKVTAFSAGFGT